LVGVLVLEGLVLVGFGGERYEGAPSLTYEEGTFRLFLTGR
jgi:hypothetical protein